MAFLFLFFFTIWNEPLFQQLLWLLPKGEDDFCISAIEPCKTEISLLLGVYSGHKRCNIASIIVETPLYFLAVRESFILTPSYNYCYYYLLVAASNQVDIKMPRL